MAKATETFDKFLEKQSWPTEPAEEQRFPIQRNRLIDAAQALALLAYPEPGERHEGGPAHKFSMALLADCFRISRTDGYIEKLPRWAREMKPESMRNKIKQGRRRLAYRYAAIQTIFAAGDRVENKRAHKAAELRAFTFALSPDFSRLDVSIPYKHEQTLAGSKYRLTGSIPSASQGSLRSAIIYHRPAFGKGAGIENSEYIQVLNRYVKPLFPILNLALVVWEASLSKAEEATRRHLHITDVMMLQPEWADGIDKKVRDNESYAIYMLRHLGIETCSCRMLKLV